MIINLLPYTQRGFCDRLWSITFYATVARLRGDSTLYFKESLSDHCSIYFAELCSIYGLQCLPWDETCNETDTSELVKSPNLENVAPYKPSDITMSDEDFLKQWHSTYHLLRIRPDIVARVDNLNITSEYLGLHLRGTDKINLRGTFADIHPLDLHELNQRTLKALQDASSNKKTKKVFIASDNKAALNHWAELLTGKGFCVHGHRATFDHRSFRHTSGEDFLVDLFALARCGYLIGSTPSGVCGAASRIGNGIPFVITGKTMPRVSDWRRAFYMARNQDFIRGLRWMARILIRKK